MTDAWRHAPPHLDDRDRDATPDVPPPSRLVYPVFLRLEGEPVLVVGGGPVASQKLEALRQAGARITLVAPAIVDACRVPGVTLVERPVEAHDLDGVRFVVAAAPPEINRWVGAEARARGLFVNAVDDLEAATAYLGAVLRRDGVTIAVSTGGSAPALAAIVRDSLEALLPRQLGAWMTTARRLRATWRGTSMPLDQRRNALRAALQIQGGPA